MSFVIILKRSFMGRKHKNYLVALNQRVVREYLEGKSTAKELCLKYNLTDSHRIYAWTKKYTAGDINFIDKRGKHPTADQKK